MDAGREVRALQGHSGQVNSLAFSPDGRALVTAGADAKVKVWEAATGREARNLEGHTDSVRGVAFYTGGRYLATGSEDGSTRIWNPSTGDLAATLVTFREDDDETTEWLVVTPDGLFDGSPGAWNQIIWRFTRNIFDVAPVEAFFNEFFYPDLLSEVLAGKRPRAAQDISQLDRRQPRLKLAPSEAQALSGAAVDARVINIKIKITDAPAGARDVRLFRNGSLVKLWPGDVLRGQDQVTLSASVPIAYGGNTFTAYAFNNNNVKSADALLSVNGSGQIKRAGTTYILAVGVNKYSNSGFNLRYAVADAEEFVKEVRLQQAKVNAGANVEVIFLRDEGATKANVLLALKRLTGAERGTLPAGAPAGLEKIKPAEPEDTVIVYFAGHGVAHEQRFYLVPHDVTRAGERTSFDLKSLKDLVANCISDRDLDLALQEIGAGNLLLVIDACNSGQALEAEERRRGPMNSKGLAQLAYEKGMYVLTAAQSYQAALEVSQLGHGLLTYALIVEGLANGKAKAAAARDGRVTGREWFDYAAERVPQMQLEKMKRERGARGLGIAFVEGEESLSPDKRSLQRPRVFYRREADLRPLIIAKLDTAQAKN